MCFEFFPSSRECSKYWQQSMILEPWRIGDCIKVSFSLKKAKKKKKRKSTLSSTLSESNPQNMNSFDDCRYGSRTGGQNGGKSTRPRWRRRRGGKKRSRASSPRVRTVAATRRPRETAKPRRRGWEGNSSNNTGIKNESQMTRLARRRIL